MFASAGTAPKGLLRPLWLLTLLLFTRILPGQSVDLSLSDLLVSGFNCPDTQATVQVRIENLGTDTLFFELDTLQLALHQTGPTSASLTDTLATGFLEPGLFLIHVFSGPLDFSIPGLYDIQSIVQLPIDLNAVNDSVSTLVDQAGTASLPFQEDFESFGIGSPGFLANGWTRSSPSVDDWSVNELDTPSPGTGPADDHTPGPTNSIYLFTEASNSNPGDTLRLISPCLDLTTAPDALLEFWYHLYGDDMGTLEVAVRDNMGQETLIFSLQGEQQTDMLDAWLPAQVPLTAFVGQTVQIVFRGIRGPGVKSDMAIDDIVVSEPPAIDVAWVELLSPFDFICPSEETPLTVLLTQKGQDSLFLDQDSLFLTVQLSGPSTIEVRDTLLTGVWAPGDTISYTFDEPLNLLSPGTYQHDLTLELASDGNALNNTLQRFAEPALLVSTPYLENFDSGFPTGWRNTQDDGGKDWRYSQPTPAEYGPDGVDHTTGTGDYMWVDDTDPASPNSQFWTPCIDLSGTNPPFVEFWVWSQIEDAQDEVLLHLDIERGGQWQDDLITPLASQGSQWEVVRLNLDTLSGETVRFRFRAEESGNGFQHDVAIDDFRLYTGQGVDLSTLSFLGLQDSLCGSDQSFGQVVFRQTGADTLSNIPAKIAVSGPGGTDTLSLTIPGPLAFQETDTLDFGPFDTSTGGVYSLTAWTAEGTDLITSNDTLEESYGFRSQAAPVLSLIGTACVETEAQLQGAPDPLFWYAWYDTPMGGTPFDTGETFITPPLGGSETFYAEAIGRSLQIGPPDSALGTGAQYPFYTDGLRFDVYQELVLDGLRVFPDGSGELIINLRDTTGTLVFSDTTAIAGVGDTILDLGWMIPPGLGYRMDAEGSTLAGLYRNDFGTNFPYLIPDLLQIKTPINGLNDFYYFFYDWQVRAVGCSRPRGAVSVVPEAPPMANFTQSSTLFELNLQNFSTDADSIHWTFGDGNSSSAFSPIHTYSDTGSYTVCLRSFNPCGGDSLCQEVLITCPPPNAAFEFEVLGDNQVSFTNLSVNADSIWFNFGGGQGSSDSLSSFDFGAPGLYTIQLIAYSRCGQDTVTRIVDVIGLSASPSLGFSLLLYPNPARTQFFLAADWPGPAPLNLVLQDMSGRAIRQWEKVLAGEEKLRFPLSGIPAGFYVLQISTKWGTEWRRLEIR